MNAALAAAIATSIVEACRRDFAPLRWEPVGGGCIHQAWKFEGRGARGVEAFFLKTNDAASAAVFAAERAGLQAIKEAGDVRVPQPIAHGDDGEQAFLVIEWLELHALDARSGAALGAALAAQHRVRQPRFGWADDNFIGASPQRNGWSEEWVDFWRERRLAAQLRMAARNRLPSRLIDRGERLAADCDAFFSNHRPHPSLLHGDLWAGNAAALADGTAVVFDPAVYCGDREADLAMTELFGGFPNEFHSAYRELSPVDDGYSVRRDFYSLYHVLNHANLFAGAYVRQSQDSIERLLAQIG